MKTIRTALACAALWSAAFSSWSQPADLRFGLVAYWPLDGTDGVTTPDATTIGNHLNLVNMSAGNFGLGRFGNAASFDGATTYLIKSHLPEDYPPTGLPIYRAGTYTITMWVKGAAQTAKYLFTEGNTTANSTLFILQTGQAAANNSKFDVIIRNDANVTLLNHVVSTNVVFDDTWHHVAWVDNRGQASLYVDGNLDPANFNYTPSGTFSFYNTVLGDLVRTVVHATGYFSGQIDDVAVWERALSQSEIQQVMTNSLAVPLPAFAPSFVLQPQGATVAEQDRFTFTSRAIGNRPLGYQWYKDGVDIFEAINSSLSLSNLTSADTGDYTVVVTNPSGSVTSVVARLTVVEDPPPVPREGLVSHWPMEVLNLESPTGYNTPDHYSSNTMKLATAGFFDQTPGVFGQAMLFDGMDQYGYRVGGFPIYIHPAYSVAFWVSNSVSQMDRRIFSESSGSNPNPVFSIGSPTNGGGNLRVLVRNNANAVLLDVTSARTALDAAWHHVVWTETNGQGRLYIDGALDESSFSYTRVPLNLDQTALAATVTTNVTPVFSGALDEVAVWNRVLTFTEIQVIRTNGIPPSLGPISPSILQQPVSQSAFTLGRVRFPVLAMGTGPLTAQWRKDETNLVGQTSFTLVLANLALTDTGNYDVVVTGVGSSITSAVATLTVTQRPLPPAELKIDFNNIGAESPIDTEAGFASFALPEYGAGPFARSFGGVDITLTAVGTTMESRWRATPVNSGDFTEEKLLRDFVFTRDASVDQGLNIAVEFLEPNKAYAVTLWSFDTGSTGNNRISDWSANGNVVTNGYSFIGSDLPTSNDRYRFTFDAISDAQGTILIQGRRSSSAAGNINVFLNALKVSPRELRVLKAERVAFGDLRLTLSVLNPAAIHRIEQKTNLTDPNWTTVPDVLFGAPVGNIIEATFAPPTIGTRFYRVVQEP